MENIESLDVEQLTPDSEGLLKVSAKSNSKAVASAIAHQIYETRSCKLRAIGAGATNQAFKAVSIARSYTAPRGLDLALIPGFATVPGQDRDVSANVFDVFVISRH